MGSSDLLQGKVLFLDEVHPILEQRLTQAGFTCLDYTKLDLEELKEPLSEAVGIVIRSRFKIDQEFIQHAKSLKFIARSGSGMENIDVAFANRQNIKCFNSPEGNRNAVGEHALGMLLSLFNKLSIGNQEVSNGIWRREANRGVELKGKTVGIIGYGNTGSTFAKKLLSMECEILANDKYKSGFGEAGIIECDLNEIVERADVLSLHVPLTDETKGMVDESFLNQFNKSIYLINTARGKLVSLPTLVEGLKSGKLLGCCLDVLDVENVNFEVGNDHLAQDHMKYLIDSDKVLLSPHVAGWTVESYKALSNVLADKILSTFNSENGLS